jgi:hypothetical protein
MAMVMVFTTILLVGLSEVVISWQKAMQREREEELIFRGKQFIRAIELWQRRFPGTFPTSVDALLNTSNMRFLRKRWKDPITGSNEWRLIKINPDGSISGLTIVPGTAGTQDVRIPGAPRQSRSPSSAGPPLGGMLGGQGQSIQRNPLNMGSVQASEPQRSALQTSGSPILGGIVGVASKSDKESLKTYNGRNKYNEWEFYYIPRPIAQPSPPRGTGPQPSTPSAVPTGRPGQQPSRGMTIPPQ